MNLPKKIGIEYFKIGTIYVLFGKMFLILICKIFFLPNKTNTPIPVKVA